jgi:hypothetical protein
VLAEVDGVWLIIMGRWASGGDDAGVWRVLCTPMKKRHINMSR